MKSPSSLVSERRYLIFFLVVKALASSVVLGFTNSGCSNKPSSFAGGSCSSSHVILNAIKNNMSPLPKGISPFEKSISKSIDIQGNFRKLAQSGLIQAMKDGKTQLEMEFPPLTGGAKSKSQFDDFDNISELDANRDWCVQLMPTLSSSLPGSLKDTWFILPDDKETELAKTEWTGQRYRSSCKFTSIRAALTCVCGGSEAQMTKAWGSTFASTVNKMQGGDGILADSRALDMLDPAVIRLHLVCQPGNGGPVEDWINVEKLHKTSGGTMPTCVVNGALDKVRNGYYPAFFFPALAVTVPFYKKFEAVFWLKPISDKGLYGWLFRVYPEPWQVVLQTMVQEQRGSETRVTIKETIALVSDNRPSYQDAVNALIRAAQSSA